MKSYSINTSERLKVPFFLAVISIGITSLVTAMFKYTSVAYVSEFSVPSAFAIYGALYALFDKYLWKSAIFSKVGIITTTNINGKWNGHIKSSKDNYSSEFKVSATIYQTWTKMNIVVENKLSKSELVMAAMTITTPTRSNVSWEYLSKSHPEYSDDEYMHYGITRLEINLKGNKVISPLKGDYYADKSRNSYGSIELNKV